jgi:hypothetical protein
MLVATPDARLHTATALTAAAALVTDAAELDVSVTVDGDRISIQIPVHAGGEQHRTAVVARYATVLATPLLRSTPSRGHVWIETRGTVHGHLVHVWTVADSEEA